MNRSSRRIPFFARILVLALILPILVACPGAEAPTEPSPSPAVEESPPVTQPSPSPETEEIPTPEEEETPETRAAPSPAQSPINDKVLIAGQEQPPETLFGLESNALATGEVLNLIGDCVTTLSYDYQPTYCFDEFPTFDNGRAVSETVQIDPDQISEDSPIEIGGVVVTDTAVAEEQGIEIPNELPQLRLTWNLNPDLRWEDGEPVTAADYEEMFRVQKDPETQLPNRRYINATQSVEAQDEHTVVQTMIPGYIEYEYFVLPWLGFLPSHLYAGQSVAEIRDQESEHPYSFGPYIVESHEVGVQTTLVSNPYFAQQPNIGTIVFKYVADTNQLLAQLETGEVDVPMPSALNLGMVPRLDEMQAADQIETAYVPATFWEHLDFGIQRGDGEPSFFDDVRVRQAFAYGINRQELVDEVNLGRAKVMNTIVPEDHPSFPEGQLEEYPYDPDRARQMLDEAGWSEGPDGIRQQDGRRMAMTLYTTQGRADRQAAAEIIQQNLRQIGVDISLEFVPATEVLFLLGPEGVLAGRRFDLAMYGWLTSVTPSFLLYTCDQIPGPENAYGGVNYPGYCNPEYDRVANIALREIDPERKLELDHEPLIMINQELPTLPLFQRSKIGAWNANVTGVQPDPTENFTTYNVWEWDIEE